jgi:mannose-6-phosphate isomerase-like protein (cupin superfamily)
MNEDQVPLNTTESGPTVPREVRVIPDDSETVPLALVEQSGTARALVWPGVGAHMRSMHRISLQRGGRTVPLHHPMEAVYYVIEGGVEVEDLDSRKRQLVGPGGMFLVDPGTMYRIESGANGSELVGGPCPADPRLYHGLGVG